MKINLKIIVMLVIIAFFVYAAGCAGKIQTTGNDTQGASEQVKPAAMANVHSNS
jgi:hypothetical protein